MCPLCEVDQLSAEEDLYPESDLEELQEILVDTAENDPDEVKCSIGRSIAPTDPRCAFSP